jgi:hypothetical protein
MFEGHAVIFVHDCVPHVFAPAPPQIGASVGHDITAQWIIPPQRSDATPQLFAAHAVRQPRSPPSTTPPSTTPASSELPIV